MKPMSTKKLVLNNLILLIPFLIYAIYKNGYLIYMRNLISGYDILKPLYLVIISIVIKIVFDLIKYHKVLIDYNFLNVILIAMIMPYNINLILYGVMLTICYAITFFFSKYLLFNHVCFMYLIIILVNFLFNDFTFLNPLEIKYNFSFTFLDILMGRNIGGISSTSILFSLLAYSYLTFNFYYKKDIPLFINLTYLILAFINFLLTNDTSLILNSEVIFASIFISTLPISSPVKRNKQIIYAIFIGIVSFLLAKFFNAQIAIYLAIFLASFANFLNIRQNLSKSTLVK